MSTPTTADGGPESFFGRVAARARAIDSLLCVGLDPHSADIGDTGAEGAARMCKALIDQTRPFAAAYKPNSAFFEALGGAGVAALRDVVAHAGDIPVVLDAKRGDIGSTSAAYADAAFDVLGAHAITLQPYLGWSALEPFLEDENKCAFVLCRTTNDGADQYQELRTESGTRLFEHIALDAQRHARAAQIGLVAAGTNPQALREVRTAAPDRWLLVPGIGAQGGDAAAAVAAGLRADGLGMLVSASRSIARAENPADAAKQLRDAVRDARDRALSTMREPMPRLPQEVSALADALLRTGCVQFGSFVLKSGLKSPIYLDLRRLCGDAQAMQTAAEAYSTVLRQLRFDRVAALPYAGLPLATAACLRGGYPMVYPRKERKEHGRGLSVEGPLTRGDTAVIVDDLATRGTSVLEALPSLTAAGLLCRDVVVLVDRESGAAAKLQTASLRLHAVTTLRDLLSIWRAKDAITAGQASEVLSFLTDSGQGA